MYKRQHVLMAFTGAKGAKYDAVRQGLGVALLPDFVVDEDLRQGSIVRLLPDWTVRPPFGPTISAVWLPDRHLPPKMRVFVDFMVERLSR